MRRRADKLFIEATFRRSVITLAYYYCARCDYDRAADFLRLIIEDNQQDEETRFILSALRSQLAMEGSGEKIRIDAGEH